MTDRHPLRALRRLLATDEPARGIVTARSGNRLHVATRAGVISAIASTDAIDTGDSVRLRGGIAYPRAQVSGVYAV